MIGALRLLCVCAALSAQAAPSLTDRVSELEAEERRLEDAIRKVRSDLQEARLQLAAQPAVARLGVTLPARFAVDSEFPDAIRSGPGLSHPVLGTTEGLASVEVLSVRQGYVQVRLEGGTGWLSGGALVSDSAEGAERVKALLSLPAAVQADAKTAARERASEERRLAAQDERLREERQAREAEAARAGSIRAKYETAIAERIIAGRHWIGMTSAMAIDSLGSPSDINRTVSAAVVHEQWVYGSGLLLYFTDGVLTTWQD